MKSIRKYLCIVATIGIFSLYVETVFATCPITISTNSGTPVTDSGSVNCVITVNAAILLSNTTSSGTSVVAMSGSGSSLTTGYSASIYSFGFGSGVTMSGPNETITNGSNIRSDLGSGVTVTGTGSGQILNYAIADISGFAGNPGIFSQGSISLLSNDGDISSTSSLGIANAGGSIAQLINKGTIAGGGGISAIDNSTGTITRLSNNGAITGSSPNGVGLYNDAYGVITTLDNGQGGNGATASTTALTLRGKLPTNYNIIVTSPTHYGQLSVLNPAGSTTFGIYAGGVAGISASTLTAGTYSSVLSGISLSNLVGATSGTYGSYNWSLQSNSANFDLVVTTSSGGENSSGGTSSAPTTYTVNEGQVVNISSIPKNVTIILNGGVLVGSSSGNRVASVSQPVYVQSGATIISGLVSFDGPIIGPGKLYIGDRGWAAFTGANNAWSGGLTILRGGEVENYSSLGSGPVIVAGGILYGSGTIAGPVTVRYGGFYIPGHSPGYMRLQSSLVFETTGIYKQNIAGSLPANATTPIGLTGYYSFVNVDGPMTIASGTTLQPTLLNLFSPNETSYGSAPYVPKLGDQFRMLTAAGGITGRFTTLTQPDGMAAGTQFVSFYNMNNSNSIDLAVIPSSYPTTISSASGNKNAQSVGAALDKIAQANVTGSSTTAQDSLLYAISGQNSAGGIASYAQSLAGEVYAATVAVIAQTTQRVQQAVLTRLGDTMGIALPTAMTSPAGNTALMNTTNTTLSGGVASSSVSSNPAVSPVMESKSLSNGNVWGDLAYQKGNRSSDNNSGGWNTNLYQLVFGSDFYVSNGMRLGGGIALSNTTLNPTYGSGTIQQGSLFAYGKMPIEEYVVDAMASFGLNNSDLSRSDVTNLSGGFRNKSISGNDVLVSLGVSRPIDTESVRITPYARVTWQMVSQSGVNEGDTASGLSVNSYTGNGVRGVLGVALGSKTNNPMTEQYTYRAYVGVGADSSGLLNPTLNASLAGMGTTITTPNAGSTFVQAGLYGTTKVSDNAYAYAGLSGEARSGQTLGAVNVGLRIQF